MGFLKLHEGTWKEEDEAQAPGEFVVSTFITDLGPSTRFGLLYSLPHQYVWNLESHRMSSAARVGLGFGLAYRVHTKKK
jgi:hypothetical protein